MQTFIATVATVVFIAVAALVAHHLEGEPHPVMSIAYDLTR